MKTPLYKAPSRTVEYPDGSVVTISEAAPWNSMTVRDHGMPLVGDPVPHTVMRSLDTPSAEPVCIDEPKKDKPVEAPKKPAVAASPSPIEPKPKRGSKSKPTNQGTLF